METKRTHFKMYKSGRRWVFACAVMLVTLGAGTTVSANAATDTTSSSSSAVSSSATSSSVQSSSASISSSSSSQASSAESSTSATSSSIASQSSESTSSTATSSATKTTGLKAGSSVTDQSKAVKVKSVKKSIKQTVKAATTEKTTTYLHTSLSAAKQAAKAAASSTKAQTTISSLLQKLAGTNATAASVTPTADTGIQAGGSVYDDYPDLDNILGVSSVFHIFAREAELNAHTNGNIAVQNLTGNVNFGTNIIEELLDKDISYIQNITNIANSSFVSAGDTRENKVVFGEGITVDISNPNRPMVNGEYIDHLLASEVYQDQNGQTYIDFDAEFAKLKALNESLANMSNEATYSNSDFSDQNNRVIDVSSMTPNANNQIVINLTPDVLASDTPLTISGLSPDAEGTTVIINVDTGGSADYNINSQIKVVYSDGSDRDNHETEDFGDNHLLWNFYDSTASDKQYTGTLNINRPFQGSILAPSGTVVANANVDGNIIADKVIVNAETHRWDLQDNSDPDPDEEDDFEIPVHPGIDLPEVPGTEEPNTEKPGTEEPEEPEEPTTEEPNTEEPEDETPTYEHEHPDYSENLAEEFEEDLIDFENEGNTAGEEALLNKVDAAIAQARAAGNKTLLAQLESVRSNILKALGLSDGLPQTGEANESWLSIAGLVLAGTLLATGVAVDRKRRY